MGWSCVVTGGYVWLLVGNGWLQVVTGCYGVLKVCYGWLRGLSVGKGGYGLVPGGLEWLWMVTSGYK